ncbi:MAG TPA: MarR family winged helix-turn-helix transcriptional regulator [Caulobacteraceae bacterium]|nr:MarR family winged helix-turn-helix transcriptional regulator [Caulobacteraceae bacterium]
MSEQPDGADALGEIAAAWRIGGADYLPYRVTLLAKLLDRCTTRLLQTNSGLSVAEWRVLAQLALAHPEPASVRQLAEQAWVDRAEVSRAAASLERRGCIERRQNPKDRRSPLLFCSEKGLALYRRVSPSRTEFHRALTKLLGPDQAQRMEAAMLVLAKECVDELKTDPADSAKGG